MRVLGFFCVKTLARFGKVVIVEVKDMFSVKGEGESDMEDRFAKRREMGEKVCNPALCADCKHVGGGDFVCKHGKPCLVISEWRPTVNYLQCRQNEN